MNNAPIRSLAFAVAFTILSVLIVTVLAVLKLSAMERQLSRLKKVALTPKEGRDTLINLESCLRQIGQLSSEVGDVRARLDVQERSGKSVLPVWPNESPSLQLNRRGQILQLAGKGKSASEIALDLGVARGEVELLLKVHDLSQAFPGSK